MTFVQAKYYRAGRSSKIRGITIHSMEAPEGVNTAEETAHYFQVITRPASAHYCIDVDSTVQCVHDYDTAFHAPGTNSQHIGLEHAGYAAQTYAQWHDAYSWTMLQRSAQLAAGLVKAYGIPIRFINRNDLLAGNFDGFTTHNEVSQAFHQSQHWDPGPGFPMTEYLSLVAQAVGGAHPNKPVDPPFVLTRTLKEGMKGDDVKHAQNVLKVMAVSDNNPHVDPGTPDGDFGPHTAQASINFKAGVNALNSMAHKPDAYPKPLVADIDVATLANIQWWAEH